MYIIYTCDFYLQRAAYFVPFRVETPLHRITLVIHSQDGGYKLPVCVGSAKYNHKSKKIIFPTTGRVSISIWVLHTTSLHSKSRITWSGPCFIHNKLILTVPVAMWEGQSATHGTALTRSLRFQKHITANIGNNS